MTRSPSRLLFLLIAALLPVLGMVVGCAPEQLVQGCRLEEDNCVCGLGCDTTFRYATREQCQAALKERRDQCQPSRCEHGGLCSATPHHPGYQCLCANTGYYGTTCHKRCPTPEEFIQEDGEARFPIDCVVIQ